MKFKIYDKVRERYLSDEELENQYYYTGQFDRSFPDPQEYTEPFKVNLWTGKIQISTDNGCTDPECCFPSELYQDSDDFILEVSNEPDYKRYRI